MRKLITTLALTFAALALSATALANGDGRGNDGDSKKHGKSDHAKKHGKSDHAKLRFAVATTDNGTCGTAWANLALKRTFFVKKHEDGSYTLVRFDRGSFVTLAGQSPGACDTTGDHGQTIKAGVEGRVRGYLRGTVTGGTFDKNATCTAADCGTTEVFLKTYFGAGAQFSCSTNSADCKFNYKYAVKTHGHKGHEHKNHGLKNDGLKNDGLKSHKLKRQGLENQGLLFSRWQDKGTGAGTLGTEEFKGDIADA
jgi:hypothetical protein